MTTLQFSLSLAGPVVTSFSPPLPTQQCQLTDQGVSLVVLVLDSNGNPVNLRNASLLKIITVRPSGVIAENVATFYTNGFDGKMSFASSAQAPIGTGLDQVGEWLIQGKIILGGNTQFTQVGYFSVNNNLGA